MIYEYLCGGVSVKYHTICDIRSQHHERLQRVLTDSVALLHHHGLVQLETIAQDGMRVRAAAGSSSFRRQKTLEESRAWNRKWGHATPRSDLTLNERQIRLSPEPPNQSTIAPEHWIIGELALGTTSNALRFMSRLSQAFAPQEPVEFGIEVRNINQRWTQFDNYDVYGPCRSPNLIRSFETIGSAAPSAFKESYLNAMKDLA